MYEKYITSYPHFPRHLPTNKAKDATKVIFNKLNENFLLEIYVIMCFENLAAFQNVSSKKKKNWKV